MNRITHRNIPWIAVVLLAVGPAPWCPAQDIIGTWECTTEFNDRITYHELTVTQQADGSLAGTWNDTPMEDIKFENNKLTFTITRQGRDQDFITDYTATLKDGKLTGELYNDFFDMSFTGAPAKPMCPALGIWDIGFTVQDRDVTAKLIITEKEDGTLKGEWTSESGEHTISNVKFADNKLTFTRDSKISNSDFGDFEFTTTYAGMIKGHELTGKLVGDMGEWQANAERVGASLIGTWEFTNNGQFGPPTRKFVVCPDMSARYQWFDGRIPVEDLKLDGDQVSFTIEFGFGDQDFTTEFTGKLDGDTLTGEMESDRGTREATAQRVKEKKMTGEKAG